MSGAASFAGKPAEPGGNSHNSDPNRERRCLPRLTVPILGVLGARTTEWFAEIRLPDRMLESDDAIQCERALEFLLTFFESQLRGLLPNAIRMPSKYLGRLNASRV